MANVVYDLLDVEQGTDAWLQERLKWVTASQVPALFGLCKYQKMSQVLEEKITGKETVDPSKEFIFRKGHNAELSAREWAEAEFEIKFPPTVVLSRTCEGLLASLDGFNQERNLILEAKYMGAENLEKVKQGIVQIHHQYQVQAQLLASGAKACIYFATTTNGDSAILQIKPSPELFEKISAAVLTFMGELQELRHLKQIYEKHKSDLSEKYRSIGQRPLRILPSGAKDPFRVRAR